MQQSDAFVEYVEVCGQADYKGPYMARVGKKKAGRLLDGSTHDDLPWVVVEGVQKEAKVGKIGYEHAVNLLGDILSQDDGLTLKADGIYVVLPPEDILKLLTPDEIAAISMHPKNDLTKPALKFPCTIKEFESFVEFFGLDDEVVRERMKKVWIGGILRY